MTATYEDARTEAGAVRDLAYQAAQPVALAPGTFTVLRAVDGTFAEYDLRGALPAFKTGTVTVRDVASFKTYWEKHSDDASDVFADLKTAVITAVLDAHSRDAAAWERHRLVLALTPLQAWQDWADKDRKMMAQLDFAEFVEDHLADIAPEGPVQAADLLEMVQHFTAQRKVSYASSQRLDSGEIAFTYAEDTASSGGRKHVVEVPTAFTLAIRPFDDSPQATRVDVRLRHRVPRDAGDPVRFGVFLDRPDQVWDAAVREVVAKVAEVAGRPVMIGAPAGR